MTVVGYLRTPDNAPRGQFADPDKINEFGDLRPVSSGHILTSEGG